MNNIEMIDLPVVFYKSMIDLPVEFYKSIIDLPVVFYKSIIYYSSVQIVYPHISHIFLPSHSCSYHSSASIVGFPQWFFGINCILKMFNAPFISVDCLLAWGFPSTDFFSVHWLVITSS